MSNEQEFWLVILNQWDDEIKIKDLKGENLDNVIKQSLMLLGELHEQRINEEQGSGNKEPKEESA